MTSNGKLPFEDSEYKGRLEKVRSLMSRLGLDALLIHSPENTYYLTGLRSLGYSIYQALMVTPTAEPVFVTRSWEAASSVPGTSNIRSTIGYADVQDPLPLVQQLLAERGIANGRIGV